MSDRWIYTNANPAHNHVGDCTVRAISVALGQDWETTYVALAVCGYLMADMPSANHVWGAYLKRKGFIRHVVDDKGKDRYTVDDFCADNPNGVYVLSLSSHVIAVIDGKYHDTWDSGDEIPIYYWQREV